MRRLGATLLLAFSSAAFAEDGFHLPAAAEPAAEPLQAVEPAQEAAPPAVLARGQASWYGLRFHGRRTASGERFDMHALTAAHPFLPFGTLVKVESAVNGRSVTVRINDRGPHTGGRIIDLSHAAARAIGLLGWGTKAVVLTLVPEGDRPPRRP